nr:ATP-binding protein [Nitrospiraceae bacterium]
ANWRFLPLLYPALFFFLVPGLYTRFPLFQVFRPLMWLFVSYLTGIVSLLFIAMSYRHGIRRHLYSALGFALICASSIMLFFPVNIGAQMWKFGHIVRPAGFIILLLTIRHEDLLRLKESILYKALAAFSMLLSVPLLFIGVVTFYENAVPIHFAGKKIILFFLMAATLAMVLAFALRLVDGLIRPILRLTDWVGRLADNGLSKRIDMSGNDELGELVNAFNDMSMKLEQSSKERDRLSRLAATGELAATLAHEIKNPLNAISGAASYIGKNFSGSLINEFLRIINAEVLRISRLSTALLNFGKPMSPDFQRCDLNGLVTETIALLEAEFREKEVSLATGLDRSLPEVRLDPGQVKQVLINLLINALDAVNPGGVIRVETGGSNGSVRLSVQDNGRGISGDIMKNIFNPFFTTKTRGAGIGLSVCKKIANEHGGDILFESEEGRGSKFALCLPVKR